VFKFKGIHEGNELSETKYEYEPIFILADVVIPVKKSQKKIV